jgi:hypothetical protein
VGTCLCENWGSEEAEELQWLNADIAQLVEQVIRNDQVVGSNPTIGLFPLERRAGWELTHHAGNVPIGQSESADALLDFHLVGNTGSMQPVG